jgi:hypothetical protein
MHKPSFPRPKSMRAMLFPLACIVIATPALAQNAYETHTARYRCVVLGDTPSCERTVPTTLTRIEERLEPGSRARYLMFLGADKAQAIEMARASGENPTRSVVRITRRSFSSREAYDQVMGTTHFPIESIETLYSAVDRADGTSARTNQSTRVQRWP